VLNHNNQGEIQQNSTLRDLRSVVERTQLETIEIKQKMARETKRYDKSTKRQDSTARTIEEENDILKK